MKNFFLFLFLMSVTSSANAQAADSVSTPNLFEIGFFLIFTGMLITLIKNPKLFAPTYFLISLILFVFFIYYFRFFNWSIKNLLISLLFFVVFIKSGTYIINKIIDKDNRISKSE